MLHVLEVQPGWPTSTAGLRLPVEHHRDQRPVAFEPAVPIPSYGAAAPGAAGDDVRHGESSGEQEVGGADTPLNHRRVPGRDLTTRRAACVTRA